MLFLFSLFFFTFYVGMSFPVDLLADVGQAELEQSAHTYMENLLFSNPYSPELLTLSDSTQVWCTTQWTAVVIAVYYSRIVLTLH